MDFEKLYAKLSDPNFQNPEKSDIYNYYIVQYNPDEEAEVERTLANFKDVLVRPNNYIDVLSLDIFDEFCQFLDNQSFGDSASFLKELLESEADMSDQVGTVLQNNANSPEFYRWIHERIQSHIAKDDDDLRRPFIFIYGIGRLYPYLRTNVLLTNYENYNEVTRYRLIIFYPGHKIQDKFTYSLFNQLKETNMYRAILLNEE
jgi:hypothetical protein